VGGGDTDSTAGPQATHERKVEFLDALAILMGCEETMGGALPDGRRPDVLRLDSRRRILFFGDAKHSESPGDTETQARLMGYVRWLSAHIGSGGTGVFAVCFAKDADAWVATLAMLWHEAGLVPSKRGVERFEPGLTVAWSAFGPTPAGRRRWTGRGKEVATSTLRTYDESRELMEA